MATFEADRYIREFETAWNANDPDTLLRWYADDAEYQDPGSDRLQRGKSGLRAVMSSWFSAFSELQVELKQAVVAPTSAALLYRCSGRHTGEQRVSPTETVPATNRPAVIDVSEFLTIEKEGKITRDVVIFDSSKLMMQLGLMPGASAGTSKSSARVTSR